MAAAYRAYAPASVANLSVGFDLLGLALAPISGDPLGDFVTAGPCEEGDIKIEVGGRFRHMLPHDPRHNILYDAYELFRHTLEGEGKEYRPTKMVLDKNLPVCSGLGSSAASVVAAVIALNAAHDDVLTKDECVRLMGQLEGKISGSIHYDNVAPCFYGGLQLIAVEGGFVSQTIDFFDEWYIVSCFPGIKISTSKARAILPAQYRRQDAIAYARRLSLFVHACHTKNESLAAKCFVDVIAEPYRSRLIPNYGRCCEHGAGLGAIATGISGSGSSIFSLYRDLESAQEMKEYLERNFIENEDGFAHICKVDKQGSRVDKVEG